MRDMIEKFKHKIDQLKQNYSKLYQMNIKLKRMINNSKINHFLKRKISKSRKNKMYIYENYDSLKYILTHLFYFSEQTFQQYRLQHSAYYIL